MDQLHWIAAGVVIIYGWLVSRMQRLSARIRELESQTDHRLDGQAERLSRVEAAVEHGPTRADIGRLHARLDDVGEAVARVEGAEQAAARSLDLIHQHLLGKSA